MFKTGTSSVVPVANMLNTFPYKNRTEGQSPDAQTLDGARIVESFEERGGGMHNCMTGCIVQCSNVVHDADGNYKTSALEFETLTLLGANCAIASWEDVADLDRLCDEVGLDTIETGAAIAIYMDSGGMEYGDAEGAKRILQEIAEGTELGQAIGNGAVAIGKKRQAPPHPGGQGAGAARLGPAPAQGHGRHLLHEPDGRRPHGRPDREPGPAARRVRAGLAGGAAHQRGLRLARASASSCSPTSATSREFYGLHSTARRSPDEAGGGHRLAVPAGRVAVQREGGLHRGRRRSPGDHEDRGRGTRGRAQVRRAADVAAQAKTQRFDPREELWTTKATG